MQSSGAHKILRKPHIPLVPRRLAPVGCGFLAMLLTAYMVPLWVAPTLAALCCILWWARRRHPKIEGYGARVLLGMTMGLAVFAVWQLFYFHSLDSVYGKTAQVEGSCVAYLSGSEEIDSNTALLEIYRLDGRTLAIPVRAMAYRTHLEVGQPFSGTAVFASLQKGSYYLYDLSQGVVAVVQDGTFSATGPAKGLRGVLYRWQKYLSRAICHSGGEGRFAAVMAAMAVGDRNGLDADIRQTFQRAGISHLLAVSGLHLASVVGVVLWLLGRAGVSARSRSLGAMAATLLFMGLTGFSPSVCRAGGMVLIGQLAPVLGREADGITSLATAAMAMLFVQPYMAVNMGFLLSVASVGGLLLVQETGRADKAETSRTAVLLRTSIVVTISTLPVLCLFGGGVSLLSPLANLFCIPLAAPILFFSWGAGLLASLVPSLPFLSVFFGLLARSLVQLLYGLALAFSSFSWAYIKVKGPLPLLAVLAGLLAFYAARRLWPQRTVPVLLAAISPVLAALLFWCVLSLGMVRVAYLRDGAGLVCTGAGRSVVVFCGTGRDVKSVVYYLQEQGLSQVDLLVDVSGRDLQHALQSRLRPAETIYGKDVPIGAVFSLCPGLDMGLRRQGDGFYATLYGCQRQVMFCLDSAEPPAEEMDIVVVSHAAKGSGATLVCTDPEASFAGFDEQLFIETPVLWLRPNGGVKILEE